MKKKDAGLFEALCFSLCRRPEFLPFGNRSWYFHHFDNGQLFPLSNFDCQSTDCWDYDKLEGTSRERCTGATEMKVSLMKDNCCQQVFLLWLEKKCQPQLLCEIIFFLSFKTTSRRKMELSKHSLRISPPLKLLIDSLSQSTFPCITTATNVQ